MDTKEKQKIYYEKNKERIKKASLEYYYKHQQERIEYNREYWSTHKDKYLKERAENRDFKAKHRVYYRHYKELKHKEEKNIQMKDLIIYDNINNKNLTVYFN
jgi:hypothetical protein